ncbi:hypothetical protein SLE2022_049570 [Rubroshorea leprosula]
MLAVSPLTSTSKDGKQGEMESFCPGVEEYPDFGEGSLLESIDFDDLFMGINDGDALPDLGMDPEILATVSGGEESEMNTSATSEKAELDNGGKREDKASGLGSGSSISSKEGEIMSERDEAEIKAKSEGDTARKSSAAQAKNNNQGKRKVKVDWTPELHRRFVQAVEQLGVDKAVPSRILELMGIDCLTRHNVASHLQKYRSHRKHLLAREVEAASWGQKRQIYVAGGGGKRDTSPWLSPTMGFPPITPMYHQFRPLHVWGHPSMHQSLMHMWPKHLAHSPLPPPPPPPAWAPPPAPDPSFWHHQRVPNGAPCFPQPPSTMRFPAPPVPGFPPHHAMYKADPGIGIPTSGQSGSQSQLVDFHPSKESIDAAIEDVLSKPWLPLPLGLKPPSNDSVMGALQRQGVPKVPPSCSPVLEVHFYQ